MPQDENTPRRCQTVRFDGKRKDHADTRLIRATLLNSKSRKRKRNLRKGTLIAAVEQKKIKRLIPYK